MRSHFAFLLIAAAAVATTNSASIWQPLHRYVYHVKSSSVTAMRQHEKHSSGILMKSVLTIDVVSPDKLIAKITDAHHARMQDMLIKASLPDIPEEGLHSEETPISKSVFEIHLSDGIVKQIKAEKKVSIWEVNLLKGIMGQLQVHMANDHIGPLSLHEAESDKKHLWLYKVQEDSIAGNCEILYDLLPEVSMADPKWVHLPHQTVGDHVNVLHIRKSKNYKNCTTRSFHTLAPSSPKGLLEAPEEAVSQYSLNHIVATGATEDLVIQKSHMLHIIQVKSRNDDRFNGIVYSRTKTNLIDIKAIDKTQIPTLSSENVFVINNLMFMQTEDKDQQLKDNIPQGSKRRTTTEVPYYDENMGRTAKTFVIPESDIHEAPNNLLMSYLMSSKSISQKLSEDGRLMKIVAQLMEKIKNELTVSKERVSHESLEQHLILRHLIRLMNAEQIYMLIDNPKLELNKPSSQRPLSWHILRDVISHAGTEASLQVLGHLIQKGKLSMLEAVKVLSEIPKVVRTPTAKYVDDFFHFITLTMLNTIPPLHVTAHVSFGELIRHVAIDAESHNGLSPDGWKILENVKKLYLTYLDAGLNRAIREENSLKIQTYIKTLGLTGQERVIYIFKYHLEESKLTKYERLMIISSLSTLTKLKPTLTRPILNKIYLNHHADSDARCMAAHLIIMSNPPLMTLQRMARMTNTDTNEHLNAVVKSSIESLAKLHHPEWSSIIVKAQKAKKLLTHKEYSLAHSTGLWKDVLSDPIVHRYDLKTIGSVDTNIPKAVHIAISTAFDHLEESSLELSYAVSSVKQLIGHLMGEKVNSNEKNDDIANMLQFKENNILPIEGHVKLNSLYTSLYLPFNQHRIDKLKEDWINYMWHNQQEALQYLFNFDVEIAFPMENGLPFFYEVNSPLLLELNVMNKEDLDENVWKKSEGNIDAIMTHKLQTRFGFATPFEHHQYMSAIDLHSFMRLPITYDVNVKVDSMSKQTLDIKFFLDAHSSSQTKLIHFAIVPMTAHKSIWDLTPLSLRRMTHKVPPTDITTISVGEESIAVDTEDQDKKKTHTDLLSYLLELPGNILETYSESKPNIFNFEVNVKPEVAQEKIIDVHLTHLQSHETNLQESKLHKLLVNHGKDSTHDVDRKELFLKHFTKGIEGKSIDLHMLDIVLEVPILLKNKHQTITMGVKNSAVDSKLKLLAHWNLHSLNKQEDVKICLYANVHSSQHTPLNTPTAVHHTPKQIAILEVQTGENCKEAQILTMNVTTVRSPHLQNHLLKSEVLHMCKLEVEKGNKGLWACQKTNELAELRDRTLISVGPTFIKPMVISAIKSKIEQLGLRNLKTTVHQDIIYERPLTRPDLVSEPLGFLKDIVTSLLHSSVAQMDLTAGSTNLPSNLVDRKVEQHPTNLWCSIDKNEIITLDGTVLPLELEYCWYIVLITHPEHSLVAQTRKKQTGKGRDLIISVDTELTIYMSGTDGIIKITVNRKVVTLSEHESYKVVDDELQQTIIEILELPDHSVSFISEKYGIKGVFDGERLLIHLSDKHRSSVRGLCGDYNQNKNSDFTTPQKCFARGPKDFVNSYALPLKCPSEIAVARCGGVPPNIFEIIHKSRKQSVKRQHKDKKPQPGISSMIHVTKVLELDDKICFTTHPVATCMEGTIPIDVIHKPIDMHCSPKTKTALHMKASIEHGATPNLSHKTVSMTHEYPIPFTCGVEKHSDG